MSHRKEEGNQVGCLGEVVFESLLKNKGIAFIDDRQSTKHDYIVNGYTVDVKTKDRTVRPLKHFDNSVPAYNHEHQRPNYYYFISLLRDKLVPTNSIRRFTYAFIVGGIDIGVLDERGTRWKAGDVDPSNGTKFWTDTININMGFLLENKTMINIFASQSGRSP